MIDKIIIEDKIKQMRQMKIDFKEAYSSLEKDLLVTALDCKTYKELYLLVKASTATSEEFNLAMYKLIPIFLGKF